MLRPRPSPPEPAAGSQRLPRRSQEERGSRDQQWAPAPPRSPRHALLQQHVKHISLQRLPLPGVPLRPRPVSLQETQLCLDRVSLELAPLFQPTAAEERPPQYQISPPEEGEPPVYHSLPTDQPPQYRPPITQEQAPLYRPPTSEEQTPLYRPSPQSPSLSPPRCGADPGPPLAGLDPGALYRLSVLPRSPSDPPGRPQRVSLQEVRLGPAPAAARRPQRVSLQETGAHGAGRDGQRRGRKCGVSGHHPGAQGRPWTLDLAELAEK
ncbi:proline-rich extensin-like protein EPR1 [Amphibalanus amphitrite]|uniref:proline-rich extensin-like protein EPR1 n=1 Tax=Amphibalanus amphitrite TaxID=1232801 RepID=UPI001C90BC1A|nr:proline-rich extensin-like protein EPR1 [Amphibalanus amphitrite]